MKYKSSHPAQFLLFLATLIWFFSFLSTLKMETTTNETQKVRKSTRIKNGESRYQLSVNCPICNKTFPSDRVEQHVNTCLNKSQPKAEKKKNENLQEKQSKKRKLKDAKDISSENDSNSTIAVNLTRKKTKMEENNALSQTSSQLKKRKKNDEISSRIEVLSSSSSPKSIQEKNKTKSSSKSNLKSQPKLVSGKNKVSFAKEAEENNVEPRNGNTSKSKKLSNALLYYNIGK